MYRLSIFVASLTLGVATLGGGVSAQETPGEAIVNGGYSVSDPSNPIVAAEGESRTYGDIATGNTGGDFYGDPAGLASIQSHDAIASSVPPPDLTPDDDGGLDFSGALAPAPADETTTTTAETTTTDGATTTEGAAPVEGTTTTTTAAPSACAGYATWYDAQVAYESAGGLGGDPGLVQSVDPDYDGVACEELIVY